MARCSALFVAMVILGAALSGCGGQRGWEVTAENNATAAVSIVVTMADGSSTAKIDDLAPGKNVTLIGGHGDTIVNTVKVSRGKEEHILKADAKLPAGKRFAIVVSPDLTVATSVVDK